MKPDSIKLEFKMTDRLFRIFSTLIFITVLLSACSGTQPAMLNRKENSND
jgi:hypothetical protein